MLDCNDDLDMSNNQCSAGVPFILSSWHTGLFWICWEQGAAQSAGRLSQMLRLDWACARRVQLALEHGNGALARDAVLAKCVFSRKAKNK